ncbi:sensory box protein [Streptococcus pneumoniae]|nr:sensory box protein [Streptococcus pneumoniae]
MADERIHVLRDILLELHNGASPESVQERFDATFAGVSAIEISLMEHELMNSIVRNRFDCPDRFVLFLFHFTIKKGFCIF